MEMGSDAPIFVWWDMLSCEIPKGGDASLIARNIEYALKGVDCRGPVSMLAYGDTGLIDESAQEALRIAGIRLTNLPRGVTNVAFKTIVIDMMSWVDQNQELTANYMLISGDRLLSRFLHTIRGSHRGSNILLAHPGDVPDVLASAVKAVWSWTNLLEGGPPFPPLQRPKLFSKGQLTKIHDIGENSNVQLGLAEDEMYARAPTYVWWDMDSCPVPKGVDASVIKNNIESALFGMDYCGPVHISAYGNVNLIDVSVQDALSINGIGIIYIPKGAKMNCCQKILSDMEQRVIHNLPLANYLIISGNHDFFYALHQLGFQGNNILLALPCNVSHAFASVAKAVWSWTDLLAGGPPFPPSSLTMENDQVSKIY